MYLIGPISWSYLISSTEKLNNGNKCLIISPNIYKEYVISKSVCYTQWPLGLSYKHFVWSSAFGDYVSNKVSSIFTTALNFCQVQDPMRFPMVSALNRWAFCAKIERTRSGSWGFIQRRWIIYLALYMDDCSSPSFSICQCRMNFCILYGSNCDWDN